MRPKPPQQTKLFDLIRSMGLKQSQVARLSGLSENRISRLCRGEYAPTPEELRQLARALSVPLEQLADPLAGLEPEEALVERICTWLRTSEGRLFAGRLGQVMEG